MSGVTTLAVDSLRTDLAGFGAGEGGVWSDPAVYTALLQSETITRGPQSWTTTHEYRTSSFNDYGQPWKTWYSGDFTRWVERTFQAGFGPHIVGRIASTWTRLGAEGIGATWMYDLATGFLTSYVGPQSPRLRYTAHSDGNLASVKDDLNNETTIENYRSGTPEIIRTPKTRSDFSINEDGAIAYGGNAVVVHTNYDALFRPIKTWSHGLNPVFTFYDNVDATSAWSERNGVVIAGVLVDGFGRPVEESARPGGVKVRTQYDACGRPVFRSTPHTTGSGSVGTHTVFDALGRPTQITGPDGAITTLSYQGIDVTVTDAEGRTTFYNYSAVGSPAAPRLAGVRDAANVWTTYTHDVIDQLVRISGPGSVPDRVWVNNGDAPKLGHVRRTVTAWLSGQSQRFSLLLQHITFRVGPKVESVRTLGRRAEGAVHSFQSWFRACVRLRAKLVSTQRGAAFHTSGAAGLVPPLRAKGDDEHKAKGVALALFSNCGVV